MAKQTATQTAVPTTAPVPHPHCADGCGSRVNSPKSTFLQGHDQKLISALAFATVDGELTPFHRALLGLVDNPKTTAADEFFYAEGGDIMERINSLNAAVTYRFSQGLAAKYTSAVMRKWEQYGKRSERSAARAKREADKLAKKLAGPSAVPTDHVNRKLQNPIKGDATHTPVGLSFTMERAEFENQAKAYLGDKTNLRSSTIDGANWDEVFAYWSEQAEDDFAKAAPEAKSTVGETIPDLRGSVVKVKVGRWVKEATVIGMNSAGKVTAVEYKNGKGDDVQTDKFTLVD